MAKLDIPSRARIGRTIVLTLNSLPTRWPGTHNAAINKFGSASTEQSHTHTRAQSTVATATASDFIGTFHLTVERHPTATAFGEN